MSPTATPHGVIFDMDGTLTEPVLDFALIKREIGLDPALPILEQLEQANAEERERAEAILLRHEREAIERATLADGCRELMDKLDDLGVPTAILTRNAREVVDMFLRAFGFRFAAVYARDDGPPKPSPYGALALCRAMGLPANEVLMVGDFKFDIWSGRDAGCRTALVASQPPPDLHEWGPPDTIVRSLRELLSLWT